MDELEAYFLNPASPEQKRYEAVRALVLDKLPAQAVAEKFNYSISSVYSLMRDVRAGKFQLFPSARTGAAKRFTPEYIQGLVLTYRSQQFSCQDIVSVLQEQGYKISERTVENIITEHQLPKLARRTQAERGRTRRNELLAQKAVPLRFNELEPFQIDCPVAGVFFFLPYILESGVIDIVKACRLPESSEISSVQACLSMLLLKLIGNERLSHIDAYDHEPALGLFAGLTRLPKPTYMATYSCRTSEALMIKFQEQLVSRFQTIYPEFYCSEWINLDFHSIPHFGSESEMEKVWCGARGKAMKGANTLLAQDADSNAILYAHADILRKDEATAIRSFIQYWKTIKGQVTETLVFDCKLTTYGVLDEIAQDNIKFITLRKRNQQLLHHTRSIPDSQWQKLKLDIPKRKHKSCSVHESKITLPKCKTVLRQIIIKDHGRTEPTFVITNEYELSLKEILKVYARRWHIENKIAEMVSFFNLNALSSPFMIRIHFDILWTVIADTLYHRMARDLRRFEHHRADTLFRKFIDMPGKIHFDGARFTVKIRKRACTPVLLGVDLLHQDMTVPWLDNRRLCIKWTA